MKYKPTSMTILGRRAIRADYACETDLVLVGKHGMAWEYSDNLMAFMYWSPTVYNRVTKAKGQDRMRDGEEQIVKVPKEASLPYLKSILVPKTRPAQVRLAISRGIGQGE